MSWAFSWVSSAPETNHTPPAGTRQPQPTKTPEGEPSQDHGGGGGLPQGIFNKSAAPSGVQGVPNRNWNSSISSPDAIRTLRRDPHGPAPKSSKSRFFEGPFFGPFFGPPFSGLGTFSKRTKTSQSPPLALLGGVPGRLRLAVSAENSIIPCIESTCASGVFWASGASPGSQQVPVLNPRAPFLGPKGPQVKKKGSQNGPLFQQKSLISRKP